jgi:hypothetical protein
MKTTDTHAFVNQFLIWLLVTISASGSVGLSMVWVRHQISATANANRKLEASIADVQRHIDETTTAIEGEKGSDVLRRRNTEWHLGLVQATDVQIVRVTDDDMNRRASLRDRELFTDSVAAVSFKIAAKN